MKRDNVILAVILSFALGAFAMLYTTAQDRKTLDGLATPILNVLSGKTKLPADVKIDIGKIDDEGGIFGHGSGVHIGGGRVLTARHVVFASVINNRKMFVKTRDGKLYPVEVAWSSPGYDVAMLQVTGLDDVESAKLLCYEPHVGDEVSFVGSPISEDFLTGFGRVGSGYKTDDRVKWRSYMAIYGLISPGMSGGGVYDTRGRLIGLSVGFLSADTIDDELINSGFGVAVPGSAICKLMGR